MSKEFKLTLGTTEAIPGWSVTLRPLHEFKPVAHGSTSRHEAFHTVPAILRGIDVYIASIIPGPGYEGITKLGRFDDVSFMAPDSLGCRGTKHDVFVVTLMKRSPSSAAATARSLLMDKGDEINAVASLMEEKGTITGDDAKWAMNEVVNPETAVEISNPEGKVNKFVTRIRKVKDSTYSVHLDLPKAA